jgi:hypothetical protein
MVGRNRSGDGWICELGAVEQWSSGAVRDAERCEIVALGSAKRALALINRCPGSLRNTSQVQPSGRFPVAGRDSLSE